MRNLVSRCKQNVNWGVRQTVKWPLITRTGQRQATTAAHRGGPGFSYTAVHAGFVDTGTPFLSGPTVFPRHYHSAAASYSVMYHFGPLAAAVPYRHLAPSKQNKMGPSILNLGSRRRRFFSFTPQRLSGPHSPSWHGQDKEVTRYC
jgi:hypothetical protein